jgi:hypothetical protein
MVDPYNTGVGWRHLVEKMYQNVTVAEWFKQHGQDAVYANPLKSVPLPDYPSLALNIPKDGVLIPLASLRKKLAAPPQTTPQTAVLP